MVGVISLILIGRAWLSGQDKPLAEARSRSGTAAEVSRACCPLSASELAEVIDAWIARRWQEEQVRPAELAGDEEFVRRVYLDLAGRIPSVSEVRTFLDDPRPNKRAELVRKLLHTPAFLNYWSAILAEMWLSGSDGALVDYYRTTLQRWLREHLRLGTGYQRMVYELLTANTGSPVVRPAEATNFGSPLPYYQAHGFQPRSLATSVSRQFLGIQLDCAECHHHPFAQWKREQFWQLAAFFAGFQQTRSNGEVFYTGAENPQARTLRIPDTSITVQARFLDGSEPDWNSGEFVREVLAKWLTRRENPYFARATANRIWYQLLGYGLTDPPDDMHEGNPPSHPELLETLGRAFADADFDLRFLLEAICLSRTYQLSSRRTDASQDDPRRFARRVVRRLTAAQLWDSLVEAAYWDPSAARIEMTLSGLQAMPALGQKRRAFLEKFRGAVNRPVESETSVLQALALMNGETTASIVQLQSSPMLQIILDYPGWDDGRRLETLFLATLSRRPTVEEQARFLRHVKNCGSRESAWADVFWVLLNSPEFLSHH